MKVQKIPHCNSVKLLLSWTKHSSLIAFRKFVLTNVVILSGRDLSSQVKRYTFQVKYFKENHNFYSRKWGFCSSLKRILP